MTNRRSNPRELARRLIKKYQTPVYLTVERKNATADQYVLHVNDGEPTGWLYKFNVDGSIERPTA